MLLGAVQKMWRQGLSTVHEKRGGYEGHMGGERSRLWGTPTRRREWKTHAGEKSTRRGGSVFIVIILVIIYATEDIIQVYFMQLYNT